MGSNKVTPLGMVTKIINQSVIITKSIVKL